MPGRKYEAQSGYRYGFNGKEKDKDINSLTAYDYGFRIYNPVVGKFLSMDPLMKLYPELTPYQFASNSPIDGIDLDGKERVDCRLIKNNDGTTTFIEVSVGEKEDRYSHDLWFVLRRVPLFYRVEYNGEIFTFSDARNHGTTDLIRAESTLAPIYCMKDLEDFRANPDQFVQRAISNEDANDALMRELYVRTAIGLVNEAGGRVMASRIKFKSTPNTNTENNATAAHNGNIEQIENDPILVPKVNGKVGNIATQNRPIVINKANSLTSEQIVGQRLNANLGVDEAILKAPRIYIGDGSSGKYAIPDFAIYNTKTGKIVKLIDAKDGNAVLSKAQKQVNQYGGEFRGSSRAPKVSKQKIAPNSIKVERTNVASSGVAASN